MTHMSVSAEAVLPLFLCFSLSTKKQKSKKIKCLNLKKIQNEDHVNVFALLQQGYGVLGISDFDKLGFVLLYTTYISLRFETKQG